MAKRNLAKVEAKTEEAAKQLMAELYGNLVSLPTIRQSKPGLWRANWSSVYKQERRNKKAQL